RFRMAGPSANSLDGAARGDDLSLGGARDLVDRNIQLNVNVTAAENLHLLVLAHGALGDEVAHGDVAALRVQLGEAVEVDHLVLDAERIGEPAQLRGAHDAVQVAALEAGAHLVPRLGALGSA